MKRVIFLFGLILLLTGCKQADELKGNWSTIALIKENEYQEIAISNIEFTIKGSNVNAGGCSGVNFFNGDIKALNGVFAAEDFASTKMMGDPRAMEFEDLFLETLLNAETYELHDGLLIIKAPSKNLELQLKKEK